MTPILPGNPEPNIKIQNDEREALRVLLIEDSPSDALLIKRALERSRRHSFQVRHVTKIAEAESYLDLDPVDVIVLDLALADSQKDNTLLWMLKQNHPVVVTTGNEDDATVGEAFRHGAQDYLVKGGFSEREVVRCVLYALERTKAQKEVLLYKYNLERIVQDRLHEILVQQPPPDNPTE
ncbi:MAG: response regulator [Candidatus Omnitrophica bacterium]|nr:response regulator [Candidatus Omnitrophota bacterium]